MLTITAQEIVKFTASAGLNLNHFKFTKSNIVVILQTLQERSATVKGAKRGRRRWGKHRVRVYQGVLDDDSTCKLDRTRDNRNGNILHDAKCWCHYLHYRNDFIHICCVYIRHNLSLECDITFIVCKKCLFSLLFRMKHLYCFHLCMPH